MLQQQVEPLCQLNKHLHLCIYGMEDMQTNDHTILSVQDSCEHCYAVWGCCQEAQQDPQLVLLGHDKCVMNACLSQYRCPLHMLKAAKHWVLADMF